MAQVARLIMQASYWLGLLTVVAAVVIKFVPLAASLSLGTRGALIMAGVLFLCTVASHFIAESGDKT